jgi:hypothetical protein
VIPPAAGHVPALQGVAVDQLVKQPVHLAGVVVRVHAHEGPALLEEGADALGGDALDGQGLDGQGGEA